MLVQMREPVRRLREEAPRIVGREWLLGLLPRFNVPPEVAALAVLHDDAQFLVLDKGRVVAADARVVELGEEFDLI